MSNDLAEAMLTYRAKHRISQRELAKRCGVCAQTINSVENRLQTPSPLTAKKIRLVVLEE